MKDLMGYYVTRTAIAVVVAGATWMAMGSIWLAVAIGLAVMAGFIAYAHSGHFVVDPSRPFAPLRRDEREQAITYRAATYAFIAVMGGLALVSMLNLSGRWASAILLGGVAVYFLARAWLRHVM